MDEIRRKLHKLRFILHVNLLMLTSSRSAYCQVCKQERPIKGNKLLIKNDRERIYSPLRFCNGCESAYVSPTLSEKARRTVFSKYYAKIYRNNVDGPAAYVKREEQRAAEAWRMISQDVDKTTFDYILDIGGGTGAFLNSLGKLSGAPELYLFEPDLDCNVYTRTSYKHIQIVDEPLAILESRQEARGLISFIHSLDCVEDPLNFLAKILEVTPLMNTVFIETRNIDYWIDRPDLKLAHICVNPLILSPKAVKKIGHTLSTDVTLDGVDQKHLRVLLNRTRQGQIGQ